MTEWRPARKKIPIYDQSLFSANWVNRRQVLFSHTAVSVFLIKKRPNRHRFHHPLTPKRKTNDFTLCFKPYHDTFGRKNPPVKTTHTYTTMYNELEIKP